MLTLAIDCAMRWINLGLSDEAGPRGELSLRSGARQSETLPLLVETFLKLHGAALADIERVAVTNGPGYYTGIRVGLSYATSLAAGLGIGVVPVGTLSALAVDFLATGMTLVPMLRAGKKGVFCAVYEGGAAGCPETVPPSFLPPEAFFALLRECGERGVTLALGPDVGDFPAIAEAGVRILSRSPAIGLALACAARALEPVDPAAVRAVYLRDPD